MFVSLDGRPIFAVSTLDPAGAHTKIIDAQTKESIKQREWLVAGKLENGGPKWVVETPIGRFVWKTDSTYRLALCPENDLDHPVAYCQFPTLEDRSIPFALALERGTEPFRDEILTAFLILEQHLRMEEKAAGVGIGRMAFASVNAQMTLNATRW